MWRGVLQRLSRPLATSKNVILLFQSTVSYYIRSLFTTLKKECALIDFKIKREFGGQMKTLFEPELLFREKRPQNNATSTLVRARQNKIKTPKLLHKDKRESLLSAVKGLFSPSNASGY